MAPASSVIILVADGARPDTLQDAMHDGTLPALAQLERDGAFHTITSVFPSVTGPAYTPFLMGRYPGAVGLPGLRWYDRSRATCTGPSSARSYVGVGMRHVDRDIDPGSPTLFELAKPAIGALSVIGRGLPHRARIGHTLTFAARTAVTHFRGDVNGWLAIDRAIGDALVRRIRAERPSFVFAAFTGIDKSSHAAGHDSATVREALRTVDEVVARIRAAAEQDGYWSSTHLWIVSDHGHAPIHHHDDLAALLPTLGYRVLAHPWTYTRHPDVAVMVSGNAMAHLYLAPNDTHRQFWPLSPTPENATLKRWITLVDTLLDRPSVDLMLLPHSPTACEIRARGRGRALLTWTDTTYTYRAITGDPLHIGECIAMDAHAAHTITFASEYPDALVQIATLCACPRSGDIILSAANDWDFRTRYEPIPHVSTHGALLRDQLLVPFLTNRPTATAPRRTVDIMPSAAHALGVTPGPVDGTPFM